MPTYPTELRHGSNGYRRGATTGLSNGGTVPVETAFLAPAAGPLAQYGHGLAIGETAAETAALRGWLSRFAVVSRRVPLAAAFLGGWELGAYLMGRRDLSIIWGPLVPWALGESGGIDTSFGPEGWQHNAWKYTPCAIVCPGDGDYTYVPFSHACIEGGGPPNDCTTTGSLDFSAGTQKESPQLALAASPSTTVISALVGHATISNRHMKVGTYAKQSTASDSWEQQLLPATPGFFQPARDWTANPEELPIMQPVTNPTPKPWADAVADPATQPSVADPVETKVGTVTQPFVMPPFPTTFPSPIVVVPDFVPVDGGVAPVVSPDVVIQPSPDGGLDVIQVPPGTTLPPEPAGPRKKERKITVKTAVGAGVHGALNVITESFDFIDTLYKGVQDLVPREQWCSNHDYTCKLTQLYEHWDDPNFDAAKWVSAFINNQFEDAIYGRLGTLTGRATGNLNITTGLNRALGEGQEQVSNLGEHYDGEGEFEHVGLLPELTIDDDGLHLDWEIMGVEIDFET